MTVKFIDVSHHDWDRRNGVAPDWAQVVNCGCNAAVIARASYGDPSGFFPPSPWFVQNITGARQAGITVAGGYHNIIRGDQASTNRQVDALRRQLDRCGADFGMLDVERYPELVQRGLVPRWEDVLRWRDRWAQVESRVCAYYLARWVWQALGGPDLRQLPGPLFNAHYAGGFGMPDEIYARGGGDRHPGWAPYGNRDPDALQFTSTAATPGIAPAGTAITNAKCDVNAYRGPASNLRALLGKPAAPNPSGDDDMPLTFYRINETGECGISNGPCRWWFVAMEDLLEALSIQGKELKAGVLRPVAQARIESLGANMNTADDPPFVLTQEQLDDLHKVGQLAAAGGSVDSAAVIHAVQDEVGHLRHDLAAGAKAEADALAPAPPPGQS